MLKTKRFAGKAVAVTAVMLGTVLLTSQPALAHYQYTYAGRNSGGDVAILSANHDNLSVCNRTNDGRGTYVWIQWANNSRTRFHDWNGGGCTTWWLPRYGSGPTHLKVCRGLSYSCSGWDLAL